MELISFFQFIPNRLFADQLLFYTIDSFRLFGNIRLLEGIELLQEVLIQQYLLFFVREIFQHLLFFLHEFLQPFHGVFFLLFCRIHLLQGSRYLALQFRSSGKYFWNTFQHQWLF